MINQSYETIKKFIEVNKDPIIYTEIFDLLTNKDCIKNYSHNTNGIFFKFNSIHDSNIVKVLEYIESYETRVSTKTKYEQQRNNFFKNKPLENLDVKSFALEKGLKGTKVISDSDNDSSGDFEEIQQTKKEWDNKELFGEYSSDEENY